jgi:hypothetical protein
LFHFLQPGIDPIQGGLQASGIIGGHRRRRAETTPAA